MSKKCLTAVPIAALILAFSAFPRHSQPDGRLALIHINVLDVKTGELKADMTVLTSGGRITEVGKTTALRIPEDAGLFDGSGKFMIPALWNMHIHSVGYTAATKAFPEFLANGVVVVSSQCQLLSIRPVPGHAPDVALPVQLLLVNDPAVRRNGGRGEIGGAVAGAEMQEQRGLERVIEIQAVKRGAGERSESGTNEIG